MHFVSFGKRAIGLIALGSIASFGFGQLRVATWNVTNFGGSETSARRSAFQTAIFGTFSGRSMNPDILIAQEINGPTGATAFLNMLNSAPGQTGQWAMNPFSDVGDSDTVFFFRQNKVEYQGLSNITGDPRDTQRYDFKLKGYDAASTTNPLVSLYSSHLKSGTTPSGEDAQRRRFETRNIRTDSAVQAANGRHIMIGGDFNVETSNDLGMRQLTDASITNNSGATVTGGRFFDPINSSYLSNGSAINWKENATYKHLHTQDPYGSGGMDDRMDFILFGQTLRDGKGLEYVGSPTAAYGSGWNDSNHSYRVWGNDGQHSVNGTMTLTNNQMVGTTIANAIKDSIGNSGPTVTGGHLPIFLDVKVPADLKVAESSLNFGTVLVGDSAGQNVNISNAVGAALFGTAGVQSSTFSLSLSGTGFTLPSGGTVAAGSSIAKLISMDTSTAGIRSAILQITDTATGQMRTVNLNGIVAVPEPATMATLGLGVAGLLRRKRK